VNATNIAAIILLAVLLLPGLILGLAVAPWFFLLMLLAAVVPLYLIARGSRERRRR
jgi:hypothetical protein